MKKTSKILALALALCMVLSVSAFASSDLDTSLGGRATEAPPDNSTKAVDILGTRAALFFQYGEDGYTLEQNANDSYEVLTQDDVAVPQVGETYGLGGVYIYSGAEDWDEENAVGNSGIVINGMTDEETPFVLGGTEDVYEAPNGESYNSVIVLATDENEDVATDATETAPGVGLAYNGTSIELNNVYIEATGTGRPCILMPSNMRDSNVTQLADLICVDSYLRDYSTRATVLMGNDVYFLKSTAITSSWGALSYDNTEATMYVVDSVVNSVGTSGYGVYDAAGCTAYFYGIRDVAGDTGVTICRNAVLYVGGLQDTPDDVAAVYDGTQDLLTPTATEDGTSFLAGGYTALMMHADMAGADSQAVAYIQNSVLSTEIEDVVFAEGQSLADMDVAATYAERGAVSYLQWQDLAGATALLKSHSGKLVFDNCELNSRTGVAVRTAFVYDSMASGIYPIDGTEYVGDEVDFQNMTVTGDVIHDDYMRKMDLNLENASLIGKVVSGTCASWNAKYETIDMDALAAAGIDLSETDEDTIRTSFVYNDTYETIWGVRMTIDGTSTWTVTGDSNLYSLTLADGAVVTAPEGKALAIYVDCAMSGDAVTYDKSTGTQIDSLEPGVTYTGVVIEVVDGAETASTVDLTLDEAALAALGVETSLENGVYSVSLGGLLDAIGADLSYDEATGTITVVDGSGILEALINN
jgi:hypothetical protein